MTPPENIPDWTNLPDRTEVTSLSVSLHDGTLIRIESDGVKRRIVLTFDVLYLCQYHHLPENTRFLIQFDGVQSARARASSRVGYEVSVSWDGLAANVSSSDGTGLEVMDADLVLLPTGGAALELAGFSGTRDGLWMTVNIRAEWMKIYSSDGVDFSLEQFLKLGGEYWDDFGKRRGK